MNEIEKQFFDTFGIEPKLLITKDDWEKCKNLPRAEELFKHYPQVTDHILLELICELSDVCCPYFAFKRSISELKETVLKLCIAYKDLLKQQVCTLFEGSNNGR